MIELFKCYKYNDITFMPVRFSFDTTNGDISFCKSLTITDDLSILNRDIHYDIVVTPISITEFTELFKQALSKKGFNIGRQIRSINNAESPTITIYNDFIKILIEPNKGIVAKLYDVEIFKYPHFTYLPISIDLNIGDTILLEKGKLITPFVVKSIMNINSIEIDFNAFIYKINGTTIDKFDSITVIDNNKKISHYL